MQFTDLTTGINLNSWVWNFGDGTTAMQPNPVHTYNTIGNYTVTLTVTNSTGANSVATKTSYITVHDPLPVVSFTTNKTTGNAALGVKFTDTSTGYNINGWQWNFGDGTGNVTTQSPAHTFATYGTYKVYLTVTNDGGSVTSSATTITVKNATPVVSFSTNKTSGNAPLCIQFTDGTTGNNLQSWLWTFGDGTTSTSQNPIKTYSTAGTYSATLKVTNDGGSTTSAATTITVYNTAPVAGFTANPSSGTAQLTVAFTDTSTGAGITSRQWNFGDGSANVTTNNPSHTFNNVNATNATYTITYTITNNGGSSTIQHTINVVPQIAAANFNSNVTSGNVPLGVQFNDLSSGPVSSWQWNFGDGTSNATTASPAHTFTATGTYKVSLTVYNAGGVSTTATSNIIVHNATPTASFTENLTNGLSPLAIQFTDTSAGTNINGWQWNFGDGTSNATTKNPVHTFYSTGNTTSNFNVVLTVTNDGGSSTTSSNIVVHNPVPVANFTASPATGVTPLDVQFNDTSAGVTTSWLWDFGDGTTSTAKNPAHEFTNDNSKDVTYTVSLTVTNDGGSSTIQKIITVQPVAIILPPSALLAELAHLLYPITSAEADLVSLVHPASGVAMGLTYDNNGTQQAMNDSLMSLSSSGGTNVAAGLDQAITELDKSNSTSKMIILLTDGYSQTPEYDLEEANLAKEKGIQIYTIGMGMSDVDTLTKISETTGGKYSNATSVSQLVNVYTNIAYNLTANVSTGTNLNMLTNCSTDIRARYALCAEQCGCLDHDLYRRWEFDVRKSYRAPDKYWK